MEDGALYNRALNLLSHDGYSIAEPAEMVDDNKRLFEAILNDFIDRFQFVIPELFADTPKEMVTT